MRRRRRPTRVEPPAATQCAWCGETLADQEVFGFGAKATPGADVRLYRGQVIEIELVGVGRRAPTFVVGADSPAAREGHDFYLMTCSAACVTALKTALQGEIARGEGSRPGPHAGP
jgi:hypothetical protein